MAERDVTFEEYLEVCEDLGEQGSLDRWRELWELVHDREAWHFEASAGLPPAFCFGLEGACTLAIHATGGGFVVYVHVEDDEHWFPSIETVTAWLDEHQPEPGFTPAQQQLLDDMTPGTVERWSRETP